MQKKETKTKKAKSKEKVKKTKEVKQPENTQQEQLDNSKDQQKDKKSTKNGVSIPRNVNYYRHLIDGKVTSENEIDWVLKLRNPSTELSQKLAKVQPHTYSFFGKTLKGSESKKSVNDIGLVGNSSSVNHLINHRLGPSTSAGQVAFETSLRSQTQLELVQREKGWNNLPKKDRKEFPAFLPSLKEELKVRKSHKGPIQLVSAEDGYYQYPLYNQKMNPINLGLTRHLHTNDAFLSTIKWEMGLR